MSTATGTPTGGQAFKAARTAQGKRLRDVAEEAACSVSLVSMVESGYRPRQDRLDAIARTVGASAPSFWPMGS